MFSTGKSAIELARANGHKEVVALLEASLAPPAAPATTAPQSSASSPSPGVTPAPAACYTPSDLLEVLQSLGLNDEAAKLQAAEAWCKENEPHSIEELREANEVDNFVGALSLPHIPASKLRNALLTPVGQQQPTAAASSSIEDQSKEPRTVMIDDEAYVLDQQLNIGGNAEVWRVVDTRGFRYAVASHSPVPSRT